jgi:hypothetical protein
MNHLDRAISALARRQGWHITTAQLLALGLSRQAISHRVSRGLLIAVFRAVYAVGHIPTNPLDQAKGAILAVHPRAALAGRSAATLHGVYRRWTTPLELTSPVDHRPSGVIVHHRPTLRPTDIVAVDGVRVTSRALTILDIAPRFDTPGLTWAIDRLRLDRRQVPLRIPQLEALVTRLPRHPGARHVRAALALAQPEPARSRWEIDWPPFAAERDLPPYLTNVPVCGHRVDVLIVPDLLIVQMDGWETHAPRHAFEHDRELDARILAELGIPTVRVTYRRFHADPAGEAARLHRIIARRRTELDRAA